MAEGRRGRDEQGIWTLRGARGVCAISAHELEMLVACKGGVLRTRGREGRGEAINKHSMPCASNSCFRQWCRAY